MELEPAQDEWDGVAEIVLKIRGLEDDEDDDDISSRPRPTGSGEPSAATSRASIESGQGQQTPLLLAKKALAHLRQTTPAGPASSASPERHLSIPWRKLFPCTPCLAAPLRADLRPDYHLAVALTQSSFDNNDPVHFQILQTLYKQLTGNNLVDCPRYGSHWEQIGFQGNDPATDLRGVGLLGILQPLFLVTTADLFPLAQRVYRLSLSETQDFPFLVLSINLTRIAFQALRDGLLNRVCNGRSDESVKGDDDDDDDDKDVLWTNFNYFYAAVVYQYYYVWKTQNKSIKDSGYVLKDVERHCRRHVELVLSKLQQHLRTAYTPDEKQRVRAHILKHSRAKMAAAASEHHM